MCERNQIKDSNTGLTTVFCCCVKIAIQLFVLLYSWCEQVLKTELFQSSTDVFDTEEYKKSVEPQILMLNEY